MHLQRCVLLTLFAAPNTPKGRQPECSLSPGRGASRGGNAIAPKGSGGGGSSSPRRRSSGGGGRRRRRGALRGGGGPLAAVLRRRVDAAQQLRGLSCAFCRLLNIRPLLLPLRNALGLVAWAWAWRRSRLPPQPTERASTCKLSSCPSRLLNYNGLGAALQQTASALHLIVSSEALKP